MSIIVFYLSFILIVALLLGKHYDVAILRHEAISEITSKNEKHIHRFTTESKKIISKIHFENFNKLIVRFVNFVRKESVLIKRKFDSKQPKFLLRMEGANGENRHSVSFFLKNISENKISSKKKNL